MEDVRKLDRQEYVERLLRLNGVLEIIPVSKSTWWSWVASGRAPAPIRLGRTTCWRYSDLVRFIEDAVNGGAK